MNKKKNQTNNFPFSNEVKKLKDEFKKMVYEIPDDEYIEMISFLMESADAFDYDEWNSMRAGKMKQKNFIIKETQTLTTLIYLMMKIYHYKLLKNLFFKAFFVTS